MERTGGGRDRPRVNRLRDMDDAAVAAEYGRRMDSARILYRGNARDVASVVPEAGRILEVATGPGYFLSALATVYPDSLLTGLDVSPHMLELARAEVDAAGIADRVTLVEGSAYELPFPDSTFELVAASEFLHMIEDLPRFFAEVHRVLSPRGKFVAYDHRRDIGTVQYEVMWLSTRWLEWRGAPLDGMGPVIDACWTADEVSEALSAAGFGEVEVRTGLNELAVIADR